MLSIMRQMNELTTLHNDGYVAGVSKFTDQLSPIPSNVGYSDRSLIETPTRILGTLYGASVNPVIPAVQTAAVIGGRAMDAVTGRRSRVAKYIKDNKDKQGIESPQVTSLFVKTDEQKLQQSSKLQKRTCKLRKRCIKTSLSRTDALVM